MLRELMPNYSFIKIELFSIKKDDPLIILRKDRITG